MPNPIRLVGVLILATAAIGLAACGEDVIDQDSLESGMLDLAPANLEVESISCPDDVSPEEGTEFECTAVTSEGDLRVSATVLSQGDEDVQYEVTGVTEAE
jgi:Domain of unknown function (DUF4333)